ncbi:MAG: protein kinase, partial [Acidobacteria bacterium]
MITAGTRLGRYEIRSKIGEGGMGEVYLAQDTKLDRKVALKILPAEFREDSERVARFLREAQAASGLNHPNICTIHEINDESDLTFIAMEYIDGKMLAEKIKGDRFDLAQTLDIALQITDALAEAHARGIVHRDIKPSNIMVNGRGQIKILDFGLAKKTVAESEAETQQFLSQAGTILGTASYMSPEQARGQALDARTDVWSFGVVLYEMVTGERPFVGETTSDLLAAILKNEPEDVCKFNNEIPAELGRIVLKMLRKARDERFKNAKDLYADLKELQKHLEVAAARGVTMWPGAAHGFSVGVQAVVEARNSIAVLPFTNMSADAQNEYFCDGLAEELLNALAKIKDLKVAARTSAFS